MEVPIYQSEPYSLTEDELRYILNSKGRFGNDFPSETPLALSIAG